MKYSKLLLLAFIVFSAAACSGGGGNSNNSGTTPTAATANSTPDITSAPIEDQKALAAIFAQFIGNSVPSTTPPAHALLNFRNKHQSFSLISSAYATDPDPHACAAGSTNSFACPLGGCLYADQSGSGGVSQTYIIHRSEDDHRPDALCDPATDITAINGVTCDSLLTFTASATQVRTDHCQGTPPGCSLSYLTTGTAVSTTNGTIKSVDLDPSHDIFKQTVDGSTSGDCSGGVIDTSNDLGHPRNFGFHTHMEISGARSSINLRAIEVTGNVCIGNIHYLIPSRAALNDLMHQHDICG